MSSTKPSSTAASSTSKRTRTVVVARSVQNEPTSTSVAAPAATTASDALSRTSSTACNSSEAKLPAYAALGSAEDVRLYESFLVEQRGCPSAAETRHGANSPLHLKASMKRKTTSQLVSGGSSSKALSAAAGLSPTGSRSADSLPTTNGISAAQPSATAAADASAMEAQAQALVQREISSDAQSRRAAFVQHRQWLKSLPIHERVAHTRQQHALEHWQQVNRDWERFKTRAARKLGKPASALVMSRAAAYREQVELLDALQKARPLADKLGGDLWLASLRGDGTRFVPVGNIFSGLFCPIRESTRLGPRVRRPLDVSFATRESADCTDEDGLNSDGDTSLRPVSQLEKRSLALLAQKKRRLRKQLQLLQPHDVERSAAGRLVLETTDLFEWAARSHNDGSSALAANNNSDGQDDSSSTNSARGQRSRAATRRSDVESARDIVTGPSLRLLVSSVDDDDVLVAPQFEIDSDASTPVVRLSLFGNTNEQLQRTVVLANVGITALHVAWTRAPVEHADVTPHLLRARSCKALDERSAHSSLSLLRACLLPGESQPFVFAFATQQPSVVLEKWRLDVDPPVPLQTPSATSATELASVPSRPTSPATFGSARQRPAASLTRNTSSAVVQVHLSCTAVDNFVPHSRLREQQREIASRATRFTVEHIVDELIANVHTPSRVVFPELDAAAAQFYSANCGDGAFSDVYYSNAFVMQCRELHAQAMRVLAALHSATAAAPDADERSADDETARSSADVITVPQSGRAITADSADESSSSDAIESAVEMSLVDTEWDLRLASLAALTQRADAVNAMQIKQLVVEWTTLAAEEEQDDDDEEDDDEEDEEDENDDSEDDNDDSEDESDCDETTDSSNGNFNAGDRDSTQTTTVAAAPVKPKRETRIARRERVTNERQERRRQLETAICALQPRLQDAFRVAWLEACAAPYASTQLHAQLAHSIATLCSEVPVIHDIACLQQQLSSTRSDGKSNSDNEVAVRTATADGVALVLARAVDEAVAFDTAFQCDYEHARRSFQRALLSDAATFRDLFDSAAAPTTTPRSPHGPSWLTTGVLLLHVDLDLAHWFTLVKDRASGTPSNADATSAAATETAASDTTSASAGESAAAHAAMLRWQFSPELLARDDVVPDQATRTAQSLRMLVQCALTRGESVRAIVVMSDLSTPPVTAAAQKLLRPALANAASCSGSGDGDGNEQQDHRARLLRRLAAPLSLRPVTTIVQRALRATIDGENEREGDDIASVGFCASLDELATQLQALERIDETIVTSARSADGTESDAIEPIAATSADTALASPRTTTRPPQIFLLEHLDALARAATGDDDASHERATGVTSTATAVTAPSSDSKSAASTSAAAARKKSAIAPPASKTASTAASDVKVATVAAPTVTSTSTAAVATVPASVSSDPVDRSNKAPLTAAVQRQRIDALAVRLADVCDAFVVDTFLPSPWESLFGSLDTERSPSSPLDHTNDHEREQELSAWRRLPVVLGPALLARVEIWTQFVQPPPRSPPPSDLTLLLPSATAALPFGTRPLGTAVTAIIGGKDLTSKLRLIDNVLDVADTIYFVGDVALGLCRVLVTKHEDNGGDTHQQQQRGQNKRTHTPAPPSLWRVLVPAVERLKQKAQRKCVQLLVPVDWVVGDTPLDEQDTTGDAANGDDDDDNEEEEDEADANSDDNDGDSEKHDAKAAKRRRRKARKLKAAKIKSKKPIIEPDEVAPWRAAQQWQYDGETAVVRCYTSSERDAPTSWVSAFDVRADFFSRFAVVTGKADVLTSRASSTDDDDDEDDDEDGDDDAIDVAGSSASSALITEVPIDSRARNDNAGASATTHGSTAPLLDNPTTFTCEWTFRAFDVGPDSMRMLFHDLEQQQQQVSASTPLHRQLIVHGVLGAVEFQGFDRATREVVTFLEASQGFEQQPQRELLTPETTSTESRDSQNQNQDITLSIDNNNNNNNNDTSKAALLLSGDTTLQWLQRFETPGKPRANRLVTLQDRKMASVLRDALAAKSNAMLLHLRRDALESLLSHKPPLLSDEFGDKRNTERTGADDERV